MIRATFVAWLLTICSAVGSSAQTDARSPMHFSAEDGLDPQSVVWTAPDGRRNPICIVPSPTAAGTTCSSRSWYSGPGPYRLEVATGQASARVQRAFEFRVEDSDVGLGVTILSNGHANFTVLKRPLAEDSLVIERAPRDLRPSCRYVIRNDGEYPERAPLDAWLTGSRSLRDDQCSRTSDKGVKSASSQASSDA